MALSVNSPCNPCSPCYGPIVTGVNGTMRRATPRLQGFLEFASLSSPPVLYQTYNVSGTLRKHWTEYARSGDPTSAVVATGHEQDDGEGPVAYSSAGFDNDSHFTEAGGFGSAGDGNMWQVGGSPGDLGIVETNDADNTTPSRASGDMAGGGINNASGIDAATLAGSGTSATISVAADNYWSGQFHYFVEDGTLTCDLSDPDSASAALGRASFSYYDTSSDDPTDWYGFSEGFFSLYETRADVSGPAYAFGYQDGTYTVSVGNLLSGHNYEITVQWEVETADGDGSGNTSLYGGSFSDADTDVIDFTASASTYTTSSQTVPVLSGHLKRIKWITVVEV
jgi:hypothetical protein